MTFKLRNRDGLPEFIDHFVHLYLDKWIPNDKREAKHIIGYEAYKQVVELGLEKAFGDMFSLMVSKQYLPLFLVDTTSSEHNLYSLND